MQSLSITRCRLEAQGFLGLDDATLTELGPWMRWSPAVCALVMATGTILASPAVLWTLAVIAALGAALPFHPFDLMYNHLVRHLTRTRPLPHHAIQRRFACGLAAVWLLATGLAFREGAMALGYALGASLTAVAGIVGVTHFCIPSLVFNTLVRRRTAASAYAARGARS
ncbi:conserved hypothetical protein [Anaeromyxobacter dehalogenans 2CP-1]|uniref:DUF4395 domain-containing protein n=1 Tax=Anaeromyxobacter dehalogenans (strain ATCC BAA-258 / DSM 21875 / 2CP-1) TaxID=455488 RepID=B8J8P8_ANAD2|nr:DUF4395 domain-containing protein [Anaeromyxobacter dehalogenans]ACL67334.1 conserved hypothetical protein [Anaeromyxobacter dehalogenans 2CP-1]